MSETYTVVLLVEQALSDADAAQVRSLHEGLDSEVRYHVLLPAEDAAARIEAAMGAVSADNLTGAPRSRSTRRPSRRCARRPSASRRVTSQPTLEALRAAGADRRRSGRRRRPDRRARRGGRRASTGARRSS